jgi:hypothetical protein
MKKILCFAVFLLFLFPLTASALPVWGTAADIAGSRTSPSTSGIDTAGDLWSSGNFSVAWDITDNNGIWTYVYTVDSPSSSETSHFILEVTDDLPFYIGPGTDVNIEGSKLWETADKTAMPNDIYGIKFDFGGESVTYTIETDRAPVCGVFHAKDGSDASSPSSKAEAWSNALNLANYKSDESLGTMDFIARPDGPSGVVPEPATMLLTGFGLLGIAAFCRRRLKK